MCVLLNPAILSVIDKVNDLDLVDRGKAERQCNNLDLGLIRLPVLGMDYDPVIPLAYL